MGVVGQIHRVQQHRVHRAAAGDRDQVQPFGVGGHRQVRHGQLVRVRAVVVAEGDHHVRHLRGVRDVRRAYVQRGGADLRDQRVLMHTGQAGVHVGHPAAVVGVEQVQKAPGAGAGRTGHPDDVQGELPLFQGGYARSVDPHGHLGARLHGPAGIRHRQFVDRGVIEPDVPTAPRPGGVREPQQPAVTGRQRRARRRGAGPEVAGRVAEEVDGVQHGYDRSRAVALEEAAVPGDPPGAERRSWRQACERRGGGCRLLGHRLRDHQVPVQPQVEG